MRSFTILRSLNLANNQLTDISPVSALRNLRELDVSANEITSLSCCEGLTTLEILRARGNRIAAITAPLPESLAILDLADNGLADREFMGSCLSRDRLQSLDVSGNHIETLISLRHLSLFTALAALKVGVLELVSGVPALPFVKALCPSLETFDDESVGDVEGDFDEDRLIDQLVYGTEDSLREFIVRSVGARIAWQKPEFIEFRDDAPPPSDLEARVKLLEERLLQTPARHSTAQLGHLLSPFGKPEHSPELQGLRQDIADLRLQVVQIAKILYVHDRALMQIWDEGPPHRGDSF
jgi:hypothetical protein